MKNVRVIRLSDLIDKPAYGRACGDCQLCCRLVPVKSIDKPANTRCANQCHKGCKVYPNHPADCKVWSCNWLTGKDTAGMRRPDRCHYVIDPFIDFITIDNQESASVNIETVQVWCDEKYPDAWRDPELIAYIERRGGEGKATIIRYDAIRAIVVIPTSMAGEWREYDSGNATLNIVADEDREKFKAASPWLKDIAQ